MSSETLSRGELRRKRSGTLETSEMRRPELAVATNKAAHSIGKQNIHFVRLNHCGDSASTKQLVRNGFTLSISSTLIIWNTRFAIGKISGS